MQWTALTFWHLEFEPAPRRQKVIENDGAPGRTRTCDPQIHATTALTVILTDVRGLDFPFSTSPRTGLAQPHGRAARRRHRDHRHRNLVRPPGVIRQALIMTGTRLFLLSTTLPSGAPSAPYSATGTSSYCGRYFIRSAYDSDIESPIQPSSEMTCGRFDHCWMTCWTSRR